MSNEMTEALAALAEDRGISVDKLFGIMANALESAYKRMPDSYEYSWVTIDPATFDIRVFAQELDEEGEPFGPEFDVTPDSFGRIAAQTTKQILTQGIREVEREQKYEEYAGREGDIVTGIVQQTDARYTLLDLGRVEALLPQAEQVSMGPRNENGNRVKAYIVEVRRTAKGPQIVVSRTHPGLIKRLFELEVPEIADGIVEIKACAREPGHRTKISVWSNDANVDPVGACVGARGSRVRMVVNELAGEKVDIIPYSDDPYEFVAKALSPAKVKEVRIDFDTGTAEVIVPDFQLSLAIGKEGQNARLAHRLTGMADRHQERDAAGGGGPPGRGPHRGVRRAVQRRGVGRGRVDRRPRDGRAAVAAGGRQPGHVGRGVEPVADGQRRRRRVRHRRDRRCRVRRCRVRRCRGRRCRGRRCRGRR